MPADGTGCRERDERREKGGEKGRWSGEGSKGHGAGMGKERDQTLISVHHITTGTPQISTRHVPRQQARGIVSRMSD